MAHSETTLQPRLPPAGTRAADAAATPRTARASSDVVFTFGFTSWSGAVGRDFSFPEDRLAAALPTHPRVGRVLICDPPRSAARKVARVAIRQRDSQFPRSERTAHHAPLSLRRTPRPTVAAAMRWARSWEAGIRRAAFRHGLIQPAVISANPLLAAFGGFQWAGRVTYYAWDDWAAYDPHRRFWPVYQEAFAAIRAARRGVVTVSHDITRRIAPTGPTGVVANAIDPAEWAELPTAPDWFSQLPRPRLLYVGSLQSRIDVDQIRGLAAAFKTGSVTLVGPMQEPDHFASVRKAPNVHFRPRVARHQVVGLIAAADLGLIPHVRSALTEAMSPLKLYEYLAGGLPVAAVDLPGISGVSDRVITVAPGADMVHAARQALVLGRPSENERLEFVNANAWDRRFEALLDVALGAVRTE